MMSPLRKLVPAMALTAVMAGCSAKLPLRSYPDFYDPSIKRVAVLPFSNKTAASDAGRIVASRLAEALRMNGTYRLASPGGPPAATAPAPAQALITGTVHEYATSSAIQGYYSDYYSPYYGPYYPEWPYTPYRYGPFYRRHSSYWGYGGVRFYLDTRNAGHVAVSVRMTTEDGKVLYDTQSPVQVTISSAGSPPRFSPREALARAVELAVDKLVERLAVTPVTVKIDSKKALRTAVARQDGQWRYADKFSADDEKMYVVLALPPVANHNNFLLEIHRKDGSGALARQEVTWSRDRSTMGVEFSPNKLYAAGGEGKYTVTFYSQGKKVLKETFSIRPK
ncbi:MAG: hypothetical protein BWX88_04235 [Planctomycetes bacterium ADurb.Bin126]|nr:MAG: hypothetical protein BWX88_04235 [Planctomycetes bacterium ADurb.Bin126]HQL74967.1 LPS assembly lipoprotein LptE [Phycisphaerae bacterium]